MFDQDFTREDFLLYTFSLVLVMFVGFYFYTVESNSQRSSLSEFEKSMIQGVTLSKGDSVLLKQADFVLSNNHIQAQLLLYLRKYQFCEKFDSRSASLKHVAFLVGTILCILGTLVIIRGVRDTKFGTDVSISDKARVKLQSSSPGLVLVVCGTAIVLTSIILKSETNIKDDGIVYQPLGHPEMIDPK